ncbi:unnamed protein product [Trichogramma brassicae]|uniref:Uncharacterized protein n=1 Tax=Trichogramma brassicae TaxID=86971 RepID=A0A6H5HY75_9HYME|nr:unnamed protein product [Trichogramma brassicae]
MERGYRNTQLCPQGRSNSSGAPVLRAICGFRAFPTRRCMFLLTLHHWSSSLTNARGSTSVVARTPESGATSDERAKDAGEVANPVVYHNERSVDSPAHTEHRRVDRKEARRSELPPHATPVWPRLL